MKTGGKVKNRKFIIGLITVFSIASVVQIGAIVKIVRSGDLVIMSQTASVADLPIRGNFIRGETSETIRDVQSILKKLGLYQGPVNGTFGNQTEKSVRAYQRTRNLSVTGRLDKVTIESILSNK